jgi:hypothetical protein
MFVTCFYAILDPQSATLTYANAGHDLPYLYLNGGAEGQGMPLGMMLGMSYEEGEVTLAERNCVLFHSGGLVEAHNLPYPTTFGGSRLMSRAPLLPRGWMNNSTYHVIWPSTTISWIFQAGSHTPSSMFERSVAVMSWSGKWEIMPLTPTFIPSFSKQKTLPDRST